MKKLFTVFALFLFLTPTAWAGPPASSGVLLREADSSPSMFATEIVVTNDALSQSGSTGTIALGAGSATDTTNFAGNLSVADDTVQKALDTLDDISLGGDTTETNQDDAWACVGASGTESGIDVTYQDATNDVDFIVDVTPATTNATLEITDDAVKVKYDSTDFADGANGLYLAASPTMTGSPVIGTALLPDASDGAVLGSATYEWSDLYLADEAIIYMGDDQDVRITHVADDGVKFSVSGASNNEDLTLDLETNANTWTVSSSTGAKTLQLVADDIAIKLDSSDADDTDWWVVVDADQGASSDDPLEIGNNATIGTSPILSLSSAGDGTLTGDLTLTDTDPYIKLDEADADDTDWWIVVDADQGATSNDPLEIGNNATVGTSPIISVAQAGTTTFAGGVTITTGNALILGTTQWDDGSDAIDGDMIADDTIDDDSIDFSDITLDDFVSGESDYISVATDDTFDFTRNDSGAVTITSSDDDANAGLTVVAGGTGTLTIGNATNADISIISDGVNLSETELAKLDGITNGTQAANKCVVADANVNTGISKITELHIGTSGSETQVTATATELNYLDIETLGTGAASKAVVLDGLGDYTVPAGTWDFSSVTGVTLGGTINASGATSFEVPNAADPTTDAFGELAADNNAWDTGRGALEHFDGTASTFVVAALASDTPADGEVAKWNTGGTITWESDETGGTTAYNNIGDPTGDGSIPFDDGEEAIYTSAQTAADQFSYIATGAFVDISIMLLHQDGGNATDGTMLEIRTEDADVDHLLLAFDETPGGALEDYVIHKIADAGTYTIDVTSNGTAAVDIVDGLTAGSITSDADVTATGDVSVGDDVLLANGAVVGITGNEIITFNAAGSINVTGATMDVDGAFSASSVASDGAVSGTTITGTGLLSTTVTTEQFRLSYDATNYMTVVLLDDGHTTLTTVDPDGAEADINLVPDGNVGIKTAAPTVELDVTGSILASGNVAGATYGSDSSISDAELLTLDDGAITEILVGGGAGSAPVWTTASGTGAPARVGSPVFTGIVTIPIAADPTTDADGEISFDTDGWGTNYDALEIWNGSASAYVVATTASDTPSDGQIPTFNTGGEITWENAGAGDIITVGDCTGVSGVCFGATAGDDASTTIYFEGSTGDAFELALTTADIATADRTVTLRDATGTVLISGDTLTGDVTATFDTDGSTATTIANDAVTMDKLDEDGNFTDWTGNWTFSTGAVSLNAGFTSGSATVDGGPWTLIQGAQTGDPQVVLDLTADASGDFSATTDTGDILLVSAADITLQVQDEDIVFSDGGANLVNVGTSTSVATVDFGTINLATDALDLSDGNITNVGQIDVDLVDADGAAIAIGDNDETVAINSSDWDISATGAMTNISIDADGTGNSIINIENDDIKEGAGIDATKIGDGSISSTEFQYLDGLAADLATSLATGTLQVTTLLNVDEDVDIDFDANDEELTISQSVTYNDAGEAQVIIENTAADITTQSYLLRLKYTDDGDADADFAVFEDNNGDDMITFTDGGSITAAGTVTGGTLTDGTFSVNSGAVTGATTIAAATSVSSDLFTVTGAEDLDIGGGSVLDITLVENGGTYIFDNGFSAVGEDLGSTTAEWNDLFLGDDGLIQFGADQDTTLGYDETTDNRLELTTTLDAGTGDEEAFAILYTVNKATSGNDTGLLINMTDTASPGTSYLIDAQVDGTSVFAVRADGAIITAASNDPGFVLDESTASDTDYWCAVDADQEGDDDDTFEIGTGTTIGTNTVFELDSAGNLILQANLTADGVVLEGGTYDTTIVPGTPTESVSYQWPLADGSSGQVLATNASGILSWTTVTATAAGSNYYIQWNNGTALDAEAAFTYNDDNNTMSVTQSGSNPTIQTGDGTYVWGHTPMVGIEGNLEVDLIAYLDGGAQINEDIDINLDAADEEIAIDQTNVAGTEDVPLIAITDARTGATATEQSEATIWIDADGVYGIAIVDGSLSVEGDIVPAATDGASLGTDALDFSDVFLATGAVVNFSSGDVTITHSANTLAFAGATSSYTFDDTIDITGGLSATMGATDGVALDGSTTRTGTTAILNIDATYNTTADGDNVIAVEIDTTRGGSDTGDTIGLEVEMLTTQTGVTATDNIGLSVVYDADWNPTGDTHAVLFKGVAQPAFFSETANRGINVFEADFDTTNITANSGNMVGMVARMDHTNASYTIDNITGLESRLAVGAGSTVDGNAYTINNIASINATATITGNVGGWYNDWGDGLDGTMNGYVVGTASIISSGSTGTFGDAVGDIITGNLVVFDFTGATVNGSASGEWMNLTGKIPTGQMLDYNPDTATATDDVTGIDIDFDRAAADTGGNTGINIHITTGDMANAETTYGMKLAFDQSACTTATSILNGISIENVTGDAQVTETGIVIGTGWDVGINVGSGGIIVHDTGTIGSASVPAAISIAADGDVDVVNDFTAGTIASDATVSSVTTMTVGTDLTVTGNDIIIGTAAAGVTLTGDGDGQLTIAGFGDGTDENITINLDDTANTAVFGTGTGVTEFDFGAISLVTTGNFHGALKPVVKTAAYVMGADDASESYGSVLYNDDDDAQTFTLPTAVAGMSFCAANDQGVTAALTVTPASGDYLVLDGVRGTVATALSSSGAAGDYLCAHAKDATDWIIFGYAGTWAE